MNLINGKACTAIEPTKSDEVAVADADPENVAKAE